MDKHPIFTNVEIGVGTWPWGDKLFWGYERDYQDTDLQAAFQESLSSKINFFDTDEVYSQGRAEKLLGKFTSFSQEPTIIATKFMPYPWRLTKGVLIRALHASLSRLGQTCVDLYQIHIPIFPISIETWLDAMVDCVHGGIVGAIGVSDFDIKMLETAQTHLSKRRLRLASAQVEFNLLNRSIEKNGLLEQCELEGITVIAHSPLAMGMLTGKYSPENPPGGIRGRKFSRKYLENIRPLLATLKKIGAGHDGKSASQVALNWVICKGAIPIPGVKNAQQAHQNCSVIDWRLTAEEISELDFISDQVAEVKKDKLSSTT
jgi:aryl-alcohol dehydrogenase-like predicted oxidoreductase